MALTDPGRKAQITQPRERYKDLREIENLLKGGLGRETQTFNRR